MPRERKANVKAKNNSNSANDGNDDNSVKCVTNKKRRTSTAITNNANSNQNNASNLNNKNNNQTSELIPPQPVSTFGDRIVVSNPFDDTCSSLPLSQPHTPLAPHTPVQRSSSVPQSQVHCNASNVAHNVTPLPSHNSTQSPPLSNRACNTPLQTLPPITALPPQSSVTAPVVSSKPVPLMSGKIYPDNQSMVFNPANPNAPPIYPCGMCHKEVHDNDQAILCESGCNFWFHRICTGISERAYFLLTQEVYAEWVCDKCLQTKQIPLVKFKP